MKRAGCGPRTYECPVLFYGDEILEGFGHLAASDGQVTGVQEVTDPVIILKESLRLSQLVLMMWESEIKPSSMDVHGLDGPDHGRTLDVTAGLALPPQSFPRWLSRLGSFPQSKVLLGLLLTQSVCRNAQVSFSLLQWFLVSHSFQHQFGVRVLRTGIKLLSIKVNYTVSFIPITVGNNLLHKVHNLWNILTDPSQNII